jgi:hypothetical protein
MEHRIVVGGIAVADFDAHKLATLVQLHRDANTDKTY